MEFNGDRGDSVAVSAMEKARLGYEIGKRAFRYLKSPHLFLESGLPTYLRKLELKNIMPQREAVVFETPDIRITTTRAIIGSKTYFLKDIVSTGIAWAPHPMAMAVMWIAVPLLIVGVPALLLGLLALSSDGLLAAVLLGVGVPATGIGVAMIMAAPKQIYFLELHTSGKPKRYISSPDKDYVERAVEALNSAVSLTKEVASVVPKAEIPSDGRSKVDRLLELKSMLKENLIDDAEFEHLKKSLMEG